MSESRPRRVPLRRTAVVLILPLSIVTAVVGRLARELRSACHLAWLDVLQEVDSAKRLWGIDVTRAADIPTTRHQGSDQGCRGSGPRGGAG
jgi:hypothetical protein